MRWNSSKGYVDYLVIGGDYSMLILSTEPYIIVVLAEGSFMLLDDLLETSFLIEVRTYVHS